MCQGPIAGPAIQLGREWRQEQKGRKRCYRAKGAEECSYDGGEDGDDDARFEDAKEHEAEREKERKKKGESRKRSLGDPFRCDGRSACAEHVLGHGRGKRHGSHVRHLGSAGRREQGSVRHLEARHGGERVLELAVHGRAVDEAKVVASHDLDRVDSHHRRGHHGERIGSASAGEVDEVVGHRLERLQEVGALDLLLVWRQRGPRHHGRAQAVDVKAIRDGRGGGHAERSAKVLAHGERRSDGTRRGKRWCRSSR